MPSSEATSPAGSFALPGRLRGRAIGVALSLALVVSAAAASLVLLKAVDGQLDDLSRAEDIRRVAQQLTVALVDAETGQRGYLLTLDPKYLAPYEAAQDNIVANYRKLGELVAADVSQRDAVSTIGPLIDSKSDEMRQTIDLASTGRLSEALAVLRSDEGQRLMTSLRSTLDQFVLREEANLEQRNATMVGYRQGLVVAILAALAGAATLAYVLLVRTQRRYSSLHRMSSELLTQNEQLEEHIRQRTAEVEEARAHAERERARVETLLQDMNHRIGNSLATVSSLLGLQVTRTQSEEVRTALDAAQARVQAIASSHRRLRLGGDLETIKADEFLSMVLEDLRTTHVEGKAHAFEGDFEPLVLQARDATTIGIMLGELVTNALKHAFPGEQRGTIWVALRLGPDNVPVLGVEDNGRGLGEAAPRSESGLGAMILKQLARQFEGEVRYAPREGGGTRVDVMLPALVPDRSED